MLARRQMADEIDVGRPGKVLRILRAADEEALVGLASRRLDQQRFERRLPILRIGAKIRQIGAIALDRLDRMVHLGIDVPVERHHASGAQTRNADHDAASACLHQGQRGARAQPGAASVDVERPIPVVRGQLRSRAIDT